MKRRAILGLDIIRLFAALLVVLFHFTYRISLPGSTGYEISRGLIKFPWAPGTTSVGRVGVEIFFVISGLVIAYSANGSSPADFVRSRILRLVPAAWVCATITLSVAWVVRDAPLGHLLVRWLRSLAFEPYGEQIDGSYWTLGVECSFYLAVFILLFLNKFRWIEGLGHALALASTLFWCFVGYRSWSMPALIGENRTIQLLLVAHGCEFALGIFIWLSITCGITIGRILGLAVSFLGSSIQVLLSSPRHEDAVVSLVIWVVAVIAIWISIIGNDLAHRYVKGFGPRIIRTLGVTTYPLYLIHQLVGSALMAVLVRMGVSSLIALAIALVSVLIIAGAVAEVGESIIKKGLTPLIRRLIELCTWVSRKDLSCKTLEFRGGGPAPANVGNSA